MHSPYLLIFTYFGFFTPTYLHCWFRHIASNKSDVKLRNQLFVALTHSRAWVNLSGVDGNYSFYEELRRVMESGNSFQFEYYPPKVDIGATIDMR